MAKGEGPRRVKRLVGGASATPIPGVLKNLSKMSDRRVRQVLDVLFRTYGRATTGPRTKRQLFYARRAVAVLRMRYGIGCPKMTRREIAQIFGVSETDVERIEKTAIDRIRAELKPEDLE